MTQHRPVVPGSTVMLTRRARVRGVVQVDRQITAAHQAAGDREQGVVGPAKVKTVFPHKRATSYEPPLSTNPTFAIGSRGAVALSSPNLGRVRIYLGPFL